MLRIVRRQGGALPRPISSRGLGGELHLPSMDWDVHMFRRSQDKLSNENKTLLKRECEELMSNVSKAMSLYSRSIDQDLLDARATLRQAQTHLEEERDCLDAMKQIWPEGSAAFDQIKKGIDAQYTLFINADDWISLIHSPTFDEADPGDSAKYKAHATKNRQMAIEAGSRFEQASVILEKLSGLRLPDP